jgi:regulator of sigma E protease
MASRKWLKSRSSAYIKQIDGVGFTVALKNTCLAIVSSLTFFLVMMKQLVLGHIPFIALLGPVGLFAEIIQSFHQGLVVFAFFIAQLSLAVGLVNLLPIPGLDGGSIAYAMLEKIRKKPISIALEVLLYRLALIVACVALVQLVMNDLTRYVS